MFDFDSAFLISAQSSLFLGLIHGINPCGHSWLILAPFVTGMKNGRKAFLLTLSFLCGTTLACLLIGLTLGTISVMIPESLSLWVDYSTAALIIILGFVLIVKPHLLHHHDHHDHVHDESHDPKTGHQHTACGGHCDHPHEAHHRGHGLKGLLSALKSKVSIPAMFLIGFVNMIIPCPTVSVMYKYAVDSGSYIKATAIFGIYAVATAIAVGGVIFAIYKTANAFYMLQKGWVEGAVMRTAGVITLFFGIWSIA